MRKIIELFCIMAFLFSGCNTQQSLKEKQAEVTTGKIDDSFKYTCVEVGWETYLPKDWNLMTNKETEKLNQKGKDVLEESMGTKIDLSGLRELVNLQKDVFNSFLSTIEKYDTTEFGSYSEHNEEVYKILSDAYTQKKIKFETEKDREKIDNIDFYTLEIKIYKPNSDEILLTQKMYSALLKGYDFAMTINYNNKKDRQTLMKIVRGSRFL